METELLMMNMKMQSQGAQRLPMTGTDGNIIYAKPTVAHAYGYTDSNHELRNYQGYPNRGQDLDQHAASNAFLRAAQPGGGPIYPKNI